jgi:hypothetical protein
MKKKIKRVAKAIAKEKDHASPSLEQGVLSRKVEGGPPLLVVPFTKKMKK